MPAFAASSHADRNNPSPYLSRRTGAAAVAEFAGALKKTSGRDPELLKENRYDRAVANEQLSQAAKARGEWEKLCAADPSYQDVKERVKAE